MIYPGKLPSHADLLPDVEEVEDQGSIGSCTANAATSGLEIIYHRAGQHIQLSRLYLYYYERAMANAIGKEGALPSNMMATLQLKGCCSESLWPYDITQENVKPPVACDVDASAYMVQDFEWPEYIGARAISWIKNMVACGTPVLVSFALNQSFMNDCGCGNWRKDMWDISPSVPPVGYHETAIIGWDDSCSDGIGRWLVQNSWGKGWGDGGFYGMPYGHLPVANALYAITKCNVPLKGIPGMTLQEVLDAYKDITGVPSDSDPGVQYWASTPGATKRDLWYAMMLKCQEMLNKP